MDTFLRKILLVDDNPNDVELTIAALRENNFANEIVVANDGVEALDYLYKRGKFAEHSDANPVVILLDIKMPRMNGLEVLKEVKKDEKLKTIPIIMLTSSKEERDLMESYKFGTNAYVEKPVDIEEFIDAIKILGQFWGLVNISPS